ncbi:14912_t:CDS:2, partial [Acaulospora colombiana]
VDQLCFVVDTALEELLVLFAAKTSGEEEGSGDISIGIHSRRLNMNLGGVIVFGLDMALCICSLPSFCCDILSITEARASYLNLKGALVTSVAADGYQKVSPEHKRFLSR